MHPDGVGGQQQGYDPMRYHFHVETETSISIDHLGQDFKDTRSAKAYATELARRLMRDKVWANGTLRVVDGQNTEIICLKVRDLAELRA